MEMTSYAMPKSWDDKGMDWDSPDPRNADYVMAIRQALVERCYATGLYLDTMLLPISPWKPLTCDTVRNIVDTVRSLSQGFVNVGCEEYKEDFSDFPRMWTYEDLVREPGCDLSGWVQPGDLATVGGGLFANIRRAIDRLTVMKATAVFGSRVWRSGMSGYPPFDESVEEAMRYAFETKHEDVIFGEMPGSVYSWSGNAHFNRNVPDVDSDGTHDAYSAYARSQGCTVRAARTPVPGMKFDFFAGIAVTPPLGPCPNSQVLDVSVFDPGDTGFSPGINWLDRVHVDDPLDFEYRIGDEDTIPANAYVPESEFAQRGGETVYHSAKRGWEGRLFGFLDYGVEGGFKFRSKES